MSPALAGALDGKGGDRCPVYQEVVDPFRDNQVGCRGNGTVFTTTTL